MSEAKACSFYCSFISLHVSAAGCLAQHLIWPPTFCRREKKCENVVAHPHLLPDVPETPVFHLLLLFFIPLLSWTLLVWSRNLASQWIYTNAYFMSLFYQLFLYNWICTLLLTMACLFCNNRQLFLPWPIAVASFLSVHYHQTSVSRNL